jgi:GxxExxY protein
MVAVLHMNYCMWSTNRDEIDALTGRVIGCAIEVHRTLGPGLLEGVYQHCLLVELILAGLNVDAERHVEINYKGHKIPRALKLDIVVDDRLVLELKSVDRIHPIYLAQVITYLKLTGYPAGLLLNFNVNALKDGLRRLEHPDRYEERLRTGGIAGAGKQGADSEKQAP